MAITLQARNDAADDGGWILIGFHQKGGDQGARGGFAVAAGDCDRRLLGNQRCQEIGPVPDRQTGNPGLDEFLIRFWDGRTDHNNRFLPRCSDGLNGCCVLLRVDPDPEFFELPHRCVIARVGSRYRMLSIHKDPCQSRHSDAADANKMHWVLAFERRGQGLLPEGRKISQFSSAVLLLMERIGSNRLGRDQRIFAYFCMICGQNPCGLS